MSKTVQIAANESIRLTENTVETHPPDRIQFSVEGRLTVTEALLAEFEGATLNPVRVAVSTDDAESVEIDLTASPSLRLETVDVGVAAPDRDDVVDGLDALRPSTDGGPDPVDSQPDVIAFTVEGEIRDAPPPTLESIADDSPAIESITFALSDTVRTDGGSSDDVVLELTVFGYGVVVHRDGTIVVGSARSPTDIELP